MNHSDWIRLAIYLKLLPKMVTFLMIESDNLLVGCCSTVTVSGKAGSFVFMFAVDRGP